jgi:3-deoxy-D-manno-octulosonic-acid transferase
MKMKKSLILNAYNKEFGKLIIVPRHPERFLKVEELIKNYIKIKILLFINLVKEDFSSDIVLVDKMGILNDIYEIGDITILGGAFEKIGGHNPIEPAFFLVIISGKNIFNQKSLFECIKNYYLIENSELKEYLEKANTLLKPELTKEVHLNL